MERAILEKLSFKTNFISTAEAVYLIVCTFSEIESVEKGSLDKLLQEALFRSYLCLQGKSISWQQKMVKGLVKNIFFSTSSLLHTL